MTSAYFDSSAIVKLYANELHNEVVRSFDGIMICTSLARVEVIAAFFGKACSGEISADIAKVLEDVFSADWADGRFLHISIDTPIETEAVRMVSAHLLRGLDAVHLATANLARQALPELALFACFGQRLNQAAIGEKFDLL